MKPGPEKSFDPGIALSAATAIFRARGFEGASLSELTAAMGIGKKSLYDTFGNKRALFLQCIREYVAEHAAVLREELMANGSPAENLRTLLRKMGKVHAEPCSHGCLIGVSMADFDADDVEATAVFKAALQLLEDVYLEAFTKAQALGELAQSVDPRAVARLLICVTQGAALVGRADVGRDYLEQSYQVLEDLLLK